MDAYPLGRHIAQYMNGGPTYIGKVWGERRAAYISTTLHRQHSYVNRASTLWRSHFYGEKQTSPNRERERERSFKPPKSLLHRHHSHRTRIFLQALVIYYLLRYMWRIQRNKDHILFETCSPHLRIINLNYPELFIRFPGRLWCMAFGRRHPIYIYFFVYCFKTRVLPEINVFRLNETGKEIIFLERVGYVHSALS